MISGAASGPCYEVPDIGDDKCVMYEESGVKTRRLSDCFCIRDKNPTASMIADGLP